MFIFDDKLWTVSEVGEFGLEELNLPSCVLKVTAMPLKRNIDNISPELIASLDPDSALVKELNNIERLLKKSELLEKVFRATNNYVRSKLGNAIPTYD